MRSEGRILIVEDEILIALGLEVLLEDAGFEPVGIAAASDDALEIAAAERPHLALVDLHLADGPTGVDVARAFVERGITVVFTTANARRVPDDFVGAFGTIAKPYAERSVTEALHYIADHLAGGRSGEPPDGLILAPHVRDERQGRGCGRDLDHAERGYREWAATADL